MTEYDPESDSARLAYFVGRVNRLLRTATGGLSHGQLSALATVAKAGPLRFAELAQAEQVSAPGVTRIVADLEARELITRQADPDDGRAVLIQVTPAGTDALLRARAARTEVIAALIGNLDDAELTSVTAALPALEKLIGVNR